MSHLHITKPLHEVMQMYTWREYKTWMAWLQAEEALDNPSRTEIYLMRLMLEVRNVLRTKPETSIEQFIMKPAPTKDAKRKVSQEEIDRITKSAKARWWSFATKGLKK